MRRAFNLLVAFVVASMLLAAILADFKGWQSVVLWLAAIGSLAGWAGWLFLQVRRTYRPMRRRWDVQCAACGYSLTGNVSGVCPECGTPTGEQEPPR